MSQDVLQETRGPVGLITLNRPRTLNALSLDMIREIDPLLKQWARDDSVRAVVIRGEGERAFCAGGDVRAVYDSGRAESGPGAMTRDFFRAEYVLNHRIHRFTKPFVALVDGISMGGGVGLSIHGSHRVVTERTMFAMPETGIGLVPDIGGGWFLPRFPGATGTFLGLTGARLKAADCLYVGYGTHHVPADRIEALTAALSDAPYGDDPHAAIDAVLEEFHVDAGPAPLAGAREAIDRCFAGDSVESILASLEAEGDDWAEEQLSILARMSPTSLRLALRQIRQGAGMSYEEVVTMEYRLSQGCMAGNDFYEGIRALLVDKDRNPRWNPAKLGDVDRALVDRHFAVPADGDLVLSPEPG